MTIRRIPITFPIADVPAVGVVHHSADGNADAAIGVIGVVIVVGGPQTRVGSHRAFVHLADALAARGMPTLRFDTRGMGDSHGAFPGFENLEKDIAAAVSALQKSAPKVQKVVLWGLCDAASAILISEAALPTSVQATVLVNPWVHQPEGAGAAVAAQVQMKHYYLRRLLDVTFWKKLFSGGVNPLRSAGELAATAKAANTRASASSDSGSFVEAMRTGWYAGTRPTLVITAGDDLVAQEWLACQKTPDWAKPRSAPTDTQHFAQANHTFSTAAWRADVENATIAWIEKTLRSAA